MSDISVEKELLKDFCNLVAQNKLAADVVIGLLELKQEEAVTSMLEKEESNVLFRQQGKAVMARELISYFQTTKRRLKMLDQLIV